VLDYESWIIPAHKDVLLMSQVFSQEKSIYEAVEGAFTSLYMKRSPSETALNLITLTLDGSIGDLASVEALVSKFTAKGDISHGTVLEFAIVVS
jgi:condensin complex subunit 1